MATGSEWANKAFHGGSSIKESTAASKRSLAPAVPEAVKEALGRDAEKATDAISWMNSASTEDKIEIAEHIFRDPIKAVVLGHMSKEKAELIKFLHEKGTVLGEDTHQTGISGTYQLGRNLVQVTGLSVKTNLKASKGKAERLGMTGHKRWYGGGTTIQSTAKTQEFTVFHKAQIDALIKKYSK